jgi:hypothetical protein
MIGRNPDVGRPALDHGKNGRQDATHGADFLAVHIRRSGHGEEVPK